MGEIAAGYFQQGFYYGRANGIYNLLQTTDLPAEKNGNAANYREGKGGFTRNMKHIKKN